MILRDYPLKPDGLLIPSNLEIITRVRGKKVRNHCRKFHNIWVDLGREYLARVVAPNDTLDDHYNEPPREFVMYYGVGIGGIHQTNPAAYQSPLSVDYPPAHASGLPGNPGNSFEDDDLTIAYLERPVKIHQSSYIWLDNVITPVTFLNNSRTVRLDHLFTVTDINNARTPAYDLVPISEVCLCLSTQDPDATNVYDSGAPNYVGAGRPQILAYKPFSPIPVTLNFSLEFRWELRF